MNKYITDAIEISSDDFEEEKIMKKILMKKVKRRIECKKIDKYDKAVFI